MKMYDTIGSIEVNKNADLVIVDKNLIVKNVIKNGFFMLKNIL